MKSHTWFKDTYIAVRRFLRQLDANAFPSTAMAKQQRYSTTILDTITTSFSTQRARPLTSNSSLEKNACPGSSPAGGRKARLVPYAFRPPSGLDTKLASKFDFHVAFTCLRASPDSGKERSSAARCSTRLLCTEGRWLAPRVRGLSEPQSPLYTFDIWRSGIHPCVKMLIGGPRTYLRTTHTKHTRHRPCMLQIRGAPYQASPTWIAPPFYPRHATQPYTTSSKDYTLGGLVNQGRYLGLQQAGPACVSSEKYVMRSNTKNTKRHAAARNEI